MVSLWPWKGDDDSPASFERALSSLSTKIANNTAQLDLLRQRSRRLKALWTLYTSFAYILYVLIIFLVVGRKNCGPIEYTGAAGAPVIFYLVRLLLVSYYGYRVSNVTARLGELEKERDATIEKLKSATKYNSTQQLLEKYGGASQQSSPSPRAQKRKSTESQRSPATPKAGQKRVGMIPPPTANIPHDSPSLPSTPQPQIRDARSPLNQQVYPPQYDSQMPTPQPQQRATPNQPGPAEFAPNAFAAPPQYSANSVQVQSHWYDRVLDVLLGEDETLPKNRIALVCQHCRLVNGQAPPGVKTIEEMGRWRCFACGRWNGEENEAKRLVDEITEQAREEAPDYSRPAPEARRSTDEMSGSEDDVVLVPAGKTAPSGTTESHQSGDNSGAATGDAEEAETGRRANPEKRRPKGSSRKKTSD